MFGDRSYATSCTEVDSSPLSFELNPDSTAVGYIWIVACVLDHAGFGAHVRELLDSLDRYPYKVIPLRKIDFYLLGYGFSQPKAQRRLRGSRSTGACR